MVPAPDHKRDSLKPYTVADVQAIAGTGPRTTHRLIREGKLPGRFEGRHYLCTPGEFDRWYEGNWTPKPNATRSFITRLKDAA